MRYEDPSISFVVSERQMTIVMSAAGTPCPTASAMKTPT